MNDNSKTVAGSPENVLPKLNGKDMHLIAVVAEATDPKKLAVGVVSDTVDPALFNEAIDSAIKNAEVVWGYKPSDPNIAGEIRVQSSKAMIKLITNSENSVNRIMLQTLASAIAATEDGPNMREHLKPDNAVILLVVIKRKEDGIGLAHLKFSIYNGKDIKTPKDLQSVVSDLTEDVLAMEEAKEGTVH